MKNSVHSNTTAQRKGSVRFLSRRKTFSVAALVLLISCGILVLLIMVRKRSEIYPYDVQQSYNYALQPSASMRVDLAKKYLELPDSLPNNYSGFLALTIKTSLAGIIAQPSLILSSDELSATEYFEHGARGRRYINISSFIQKGARRIHLKGKHLQFDDQFATLQLFRNPEIEHARVLVIAPHPDDAEIAAYGLYSSCTDPFILTITAGDYGDLKYDELYSEESYHRQQIGHVRTLNSVTVPLMAAVPPDNCLNLGFFDGTLSEMYRQAPLDVSPLVANTSTVDTFRKYNISFLKDSLTGNANWNALVQNIRFILETYAPDLIVTPHPALDSHEDHQYTTYALIEALKAAGITKGMLLLYTNHHVINEYYPYGTTGGIISLPPAFDSVFQFRGLFSHYLSNNTQGDKALALDAMNDLRPDTEWRFLGASAYNTFERLKLEVTGKENSYYKRSVRSNELFFTIPVADTYDEDLVRRMLLDPERAKQIKQTKSDK